MTAFNAVRFQGKPGRDQEFLDALKKVQVNWPGVRHANMIKTGERTYCSIAEWSDMDALANARSQIVASLDTFRDTLEDIGGGLGFTDPVSGPVVLALKGCAPPIGDSEHAARISERHRRRSAREPFGCA